MLWLSCNMEPTCVTHMQKHTYIKAAGFAEFIFRVHALIKVLDLDDWTCVNKAFLYSLPYSGHIGRKMVIDYIRNGYINCRNLLAAAKSRNSNQIEIGGNRKTCKTQRLKRRGCSIRSGSLRGRRRQRPQLRGCGLRRLRRRGHQ